MNTPTVSVIVASQGRPAWLGRCLTALGQLEYPNFEIVVATDPDGLAAVRAHEHGGLVKCVRSDFENISQTRNLGVAEASGDILAFVDDDAVPEPMWLKHHVEALRETGCAASVGYVRGRNGISFQSRAQSIDSEAETHEVPHDGQAPFVPHLESDRAVKLVGTNFTIHRKALDGIGGFDPAFRFFLDDSDLSLRLAQSRLSAAIVPLAEVHHAFAASARRSSNRFPKRLDDIGRSTAIYVLKHNQEAIEAVRLRVFSRERRRLLAHLVAGNCEPRDVLKGMKSLSDGWEEGRMYVPIEDAKVPRKSAQFQQFSTSFSGHHIEHSRYFTRAASIRRACSYVSAKKRASVFSFSLTARPHRVSFTKEGVWVQSGGQFGRADRAGPVWRWCRFTHRLKLETARVELQRGIGESEGVLGKED